MRSECSLTSWKKAFVIILVLATAGLFFIYYVPSNIFSDGAFKKTTYWADKIKHTPAVRTTGVETSYYGFTKGTDGQTEEITEPEDRFGKVNFDINGSDVLVFLHLQKTGGTTFGRELVRNLNLSKECDILEGKKRSNCLRPNSDSETWIFSRFSTGWMCGLHSDWTLLKECVADKMNIYEKITKERRYFYITLLRDPIKRFISEWKHVDRGATWKSTKFGCLGKEYDVPRCYSGDSWTGLSLEEFMACPYNMGINRQTRMIANLSLINCYQRWLDRNLTATQIAEMDNKMLESAKENLKEMAFFGLLEEQRKLQQLFEFTFPLNFKNDLIQYNLTRVSAFIPTKKEMDAMKKLNYLDVQLYDYAKRLFHERYRRFIN